MSTIRTLLRSLREYRRPSLLTPFFVTGEVILECFLPLVMASLVDHLQGGALTPVVRLGIFMLVMAMFSLLFGILAARFGATAAAGLAKHLRQDLFFKVQDFSFGDVDRFSTSSLVTRMTTDVTNVQNAYGMIIRVAVRVPLMVVFSIIMTLRINWHISLIFLIMLPFLAAIMFGIIIFIFPVFRRIFKKYDALNNSVQENIAGIRVVKSFVNEEYEKTRFAKRSEEVRADFTFAEKVLALNTPVMMLFIFGAIMLVDFIFVMITIAGESANRIAEVLRYESPLTSPEYGIREVPTGDITFENVTFKYKEDSERPALSDISLTVPAGSTLGIVGGTGSAKTSLIQLIPRLYDVTEGKVTVGGIDVRDYRLEPLRDAVSVVLQKNILFSGTIKENLRWGNPDASDAELIRACELSQADEFIRQFPDGYDTMVERGGANLSGGQKQRLCIARALLKKPMILILDDSTSAVDTKTDALIRQAFETEIPDTTTIIIAQRISSVQHADQIIVLDDGRIKEHGTHQELLDLGGEYRELYDTQNSPSESEVA